LGFCQVDARAPSRTLEMFVASVRTEICFKCNHVRLGRNAFVTRGSEYWSHATVNDRAPPASFLPAVQRKRSLTMPDNLNHDTRRAMSATNAMEVFSPQKQVRPMNERLTEFSDNEADFCVMRCTLPAGAVVPMHSHADRETFYLLSGELDALRGDRWEVLRPGDVFDVREGAKHAWRNSSQAAASIICVTTTKLARFLEEISIPVDGSLAEEPAQRFLRLVNSRGYWLASAEENAAVGLDVNWDAARD
jgi:quercetin dioxygenase-like cupin family protein